MLLKNQIKLANYERVPQKWRLSIGNISLFIGTLKSFSFP